MVERDDPYVARAAWHRALVFFAVCFAIGWASGTLEALLTETTSVGVHFPWRSALLVTVAVGYGWVWPRGTFMEDRPRRLPVQLAFGIVWGTSIGVLFLSVFEIVAGDDPSFVRVAVVWLLLAAFQGAWHQLFWDVKVAPPHNVLRWNPIKVAVAHVPNITLSLVVLATTGDRLVVLLAQVLALTLSAVAMRFPPYDYVRDPALDADLPALEGRA